MYKNKNRYFWLLLALLTVAPAINIHADGSKDLYPSGKQGRRAFLRSSTTATDNWPFPNLGTHYVYAEPGERITVASSLQAVGGPARIRLYSPTGAQIPLNFNNGGRIQNRAQEIAGPQMWGQTGGGRYIPAYYQVPSGGAGVYRVEFLSTNNTSVSGSVNANDNWNQTPSTMASTIAAWDVSVINAANSGFIPGRVYTNVLNLSNGTSNVNTTGFYGLVYTRTKDGYTYRVDNNGNNGIYFTFFVNNNGFVDPVTQLPIYKSLDYSNPVGTDLEQRVHNPNNADAGTHLTHKLFYTLPATDLPETAPIAVTNDAGISWSAGNTWLKTAPVTPEVSTPVLRGVDGSIGQVSNKGGYIEFDADVQGNFRIEIISEDTPAAFPARTMTGQASAGSNRVLWDGRDGAGNPLPTGTFPVKVTVQLQGAEVHFPFFDMEYNIDGTIIELLDHASLPSIVPVSDIVYWNDEDIPNASNGSNAPRGNRSDPKNNSHLPPVNSTGISSNINGHIWGIGASGFSGQFGDQKSIDTWTFITGEKKESENQVNVKIADLEVVSVVTDKDDIRIGDNVEYTVTLKNNGPSDVEDAPFTFRLPPGFEPDEEPVFSGNGCGEESMEIEYDPATSTYRSKLDLPNGCEITYTFSVTITDLSDPDDTEAVAGILRPHDVTDPNATNSSNPENDLYELSPGHTWDDLWKYPAEWPDGDVVNNFYLPPFSAEFECANRPVEVTDECNNIKAISVGLTRVSDLGIEKSVDNPSPDVGEVVTFTLTVTNHGPHNALNVVVTDIVPDGYTDIANIDNDGVLDGDTITWNITELENTASKTLSFKAKVVNDGDYTNTATVTGDSEDPNPENNEDAATVVPCEELNIFWEDFGTSNPSINYGRRTSEYMPSHSFKFGTPYPDSQLYEEYMIDNNHYAVVAPGYIKQGTAPGMYYFWTPAHDEPETVTDRSGTENGAVMVVNAGTTLDSFYERTELLEAGSGYRASFWLYLVNGPSQVAINIKHPQSGEVLATITSPLLQDWDTNYKNKWSHFELYFIIPENGADCNANNVVLSFRNNHDEEQGNDYFVDDIRLDKACSVPPGTIIIDCPDPDYMKNYWHGTIDNDWNKAGNWTANFVPGVGEDIIFATETNNGASGDGNGEGAAVNDLYLDNADQNDSGGRIIGNLINDSEVDLVITAGNQLIINGEVTDDNADAGTIVVKSTNIPTDGSDPVNAPTGTLIVNPSENPEGVRAVVEFYNQAYDCEDCGFYTRSWQYFGIPVKESGTTPAPLPFTNAEEVNEWSEPTNGDKWIDPDMPLTAFTGYQITRNETSEPDHTNAVHRFDGGLNIGDATVGLTRTDNVNYPGVNLVGNSYTAAIPISEDALTFPSGVQQTVYLFNTGTRDQWRKLNGSVVNQDGYRSGQYLAVPVNLGGQDNFPDRIPSMHAFMLLAESGTGDVGNLGVDYSELIKNTAVNRGDGSQIVTRSAGNEGTATSTTTSLPSLVMDVIGEQSADRVWIFAKEGASHGFDNGWDGRKMAESGIAQLYVTGSDESQLQVATVPTMENVLLGFEADADGKYTLEFSLSEQLNTVEIHLQDLVTGMSQRLSDGGSYQFEAKKGDTAARFRLSQSGEFEAPDDEALIDIEPAGDGKVMIRNRGGSACTAFISNDKGAALRRVEVSAGGEKVLENMSAGVYVIRLQNATVNDARRVVVD